MSLLLFSPILFLDMGWETGSSGISVDYNYNKLVRHANDASYQETAAAILGIAFAVVGITSAIFGCINEKRMILRSMAGKSSKDGNDDSIGSVIRKYFFLALGSCMLPLPLFFDNSIIIQLILSVQVWRARLVQCVWLSKQ